MKGITAEIIRGKYKCPLNKFNALDSVFFPCERGNLKHETNDFPAVKIARRQLQNGQPPYIHAEPMDREEGEFFAFGGSFIYCSDSRFSEVHKYPIPLHDRRMNLENF